MIMEGRDVDAQGPNAHSKSMESEQTSVLAGRHTDSSAAVPASSDMSERPMVSGSGTNTAAIFATCSPLERVERILELKKVIDHAKAALEDGQQGGAPGAAVTPLLGVRDDVLEALTVLDRVDMSRELLAKTRIGVSVGKLRTHPDSQIRSRCTQLVHKWKAGISGGGLAKENATSRPGPNGRGQGKPPTGTLGNDTANEKAHGLSSNSSPRADEGLHGVPVDRAPEKASTAVEDYPGPASGDAVRDRARGFLWRALVDGMQSRRDLGADRSGETARVAAEIEKALWQEYCVRRKSTKEYNMQLKTLKWNFADQKNPDLNLKVLCGVYTPEQLAIMSSADLASDEKKRMRELQKKESMEACQSDWEMKKLMEGASEGGQFPCFKCRTTKTVYFQMQTRSSDEPMTTFVTCLECGNRWKF
ncbi:transcription elongation factor A TFIIS [Toxoplasma gondii TgCatPRC2]|uniref:Transcription elongation factor A TFIIS n=10 Tax=Toxoplasma gondii TaxID=5811 RepID=A0A0F7USK4_TOXGV|nr:transcription elongation factor A TFIIS [Toxoplasma gondii ME49]EPR57617.1 transcription elongation factor A TFIIS [Toxoplasma gondii GT1]ESS29262.1 transcription elongation factor A TFIIS [Toxoplasma gondii VEG]KAF4646110.1 transcription elongation factor A TFIIS [Toxoplasma gondii]KFG35683.1 transcription elongation factor A TFIIS [Toxoplasma gondii p89]KFH14355.1 transcription elongation factor A TFIIS [Toxoplasma gondii MAS]KYF39777.1 transcription elongation factor A TFIIS [Toxoplasma|eukprot:XP_018638613.1 transcription elongation factor A TFIIS [Toxoplasma gondii ME49]